MKKVIGLILCAALLIASVAVFAVGETSQTGSSATVAGLKEKMDALWLVNVADQAMLDNMRQQVYDYFNAGWEQWLSDTKRYGKTGGKTDEALYEEQWNAINPKFNEGFLITPLNTYAYLEQYAEASSFSYLFGGTQYWSVSSDGFSFTEDGIYADTESISGKVLGKDIERFLIFDDARDFITHSDKLGEMLLAKGENEVVDAKLFSALNRFVFLYVQCSDNEYLVKLNDSTGMTEFVPEMQKFVLYPVSEALKLTSTALTGVDSEYYGELAKNISITKPTFTAEAESLQQSGILNGNEKGLDLLKPLTRIEAVAMLLRAIGEPETAPNSSIQTFSDVPKTHWGYGAAERAASEGIINGVGDGQFAPDKAVAATEFATMVLRAAETDEFDWQQALNMLIEQGIITQENADTMDLFTRGDMAKIIYEAREKSLL